MSGLRLKIKIVAGPTEEVFPVLTHANKPVQWPSSFEVNTALQRCMAKSIAYLGLGHHVYVGEDLPVDFESHGESATVNANDGQELSFFANITFEGVQGGVIQQIDPMGNPNFAVNNETDADSWEGVGGYVKAEDSWFGDPFAKSPPAQISALDVAANYYHIEAGTGGGSAYASAKLAYIALEDSRGRTTSSC